MAERRIVFDTLWEIVYFSRESMGIACAMTLDWEWRIWVPRCRHSSATTGRAAKFTHRTLLNMPVSQSPAESSLLDAPGVNRQAM